MNHNKLEALFAAPGFPAAADVDQFSIIDCLDRRTTSLIDD
jgi:hypothetical protein